MSLPTDAKERKDHPIARGVLDYFPDAVAAVAHVSKVGNDQHNPGQPMHWAKEKSTDHADCIVRHLIERGTVDSDGLRHSAKVAWRALAMLQIEIESEQMIYPSGDVEKLRLNQKSTDGTDYRPERWDRPQPEENVGNRRLDQDVLDGIRALRGPGGI